MTAPRGPAAARDKDPLDDRPDEKARQERSPDEAVEESAELVENETEQGDDLPPQQEDYGGTPSERTRKR